MMSPKIKICKDTDCNDQATTRGYCRFHYIKYWSQTRNRKKMAVKDLNKYVDHIMKRNPDNYISEITKEMKGWQDRQPLSADVELEPRGEGIDSEEGLDKILNNLRIDDDY
jgi:hypothetical protein